jgi:hypothetical protein
MIHGRARAPQVKARKVIGHLSISGRLLFSTGGLNIRQSKSIGGLKPSTLQARRGAEAPLFHGGLENNHP